MIRLFHCFLCFGFLIIGGCQSTDQIGKSLSDHSVSSNEVLFAEKSVPPRYPIAAAESGIEGYCVIGYAVDVDGTTFDHKTLECSHDIFEQPSLEAAKKSRYRPKIVDGVAAQVFDVKKWYKYQINN